MIKNGLDSPFPSPFSLREPDPVSLFSPLPFPLFLSPCLVFRRLFTPGIENGFFLLFPFFFSLQAMDKRALGYDLFFFSFITVAGHKGDQKAFLLSSSFPSSPFSTRPPVTRLPLQPPQGRPAKTTVLPFPPFFFCHDRIFFLPSDSQGT